MFYLHMFFHGNNTICFVISSNETFTTLSAQSLNFRATCMIVANYASHDLVHIHVYRLVVIYFETMLVSCDYKASKQLLVFSILPCAL
jgi:hypothetical protein